MNAYEARKTERIERLRARANRLAAAAADTSNGAHAILDRIPLGQPILVGHHSEKRHRRDVARAHQRLCKAVELRAESEDVARRAERAEANVAVSSDDPEAIAKLTAKAERLDADRARMVAANRAVRSKDPRAALEALGFSPRLVTQILTPDFVGRIGFAPHALASASSEARRIRKRIEELRARAKTTPASEEINGVTICEGENRVRLVFPSKPDDGTRAALKAAGFRWAPSSSAWQRHASNAAWSAARRIAGAIGQKEQATT